MRRVAIMWKTRRWGSHISVFLWKLFENLFYMDFYSLFKLATKGAPELLSKHLYSLCTGKMGQKFSVERTNK